MTPDSERERESEGKPGMQDTQAPLQTCEPEKKKIILYKRSSCQRNKDGRDVNRSLLTGQAGEQW